MNESFRSSWLKVRRANKHINDIHEMLLAFSNSDFYATSIDYDSERRINFVCFEIDTSKFPSDEAALAIGDALHNLRSALDHLWHETVLACGGTPSNYSKFPFFGARTELAKWLGEAQKQKRITFKIAECVESSVQSYKDGNAHLWGLNDANIVDKHQLLVPVLKVMGFDKIRIEDSQHNRVGDSLYIMDESCRIRISDADYQRVELKDKGRALTPILLFDLATPFPGEAVVPTLKGASEEVAKTIGNFEVLMFQSP